MIARLAACVVAMVGDGSAFSKRVESELASSLPCLDVSSELAATTSYAVVVRIASRRAVEIWERGAVATVLRLDASDEVDAVKIAEHVRARSLTIASTEPHPTEALRWEEPTISTVPAVPAATRVPDTASDGFRFALSGGVGVVLEAGAAGLGARVAARTRIVERFGGGATLVVPLVPATVTGAAAVGETEISTVAAGPLLDVELGPRSSAARAFFGVACLIAHTRAAGFATHPLESRRDAQTRFVPTLTASVMYAVSSRIGVELGGGVGAAIPTLDVRFGGRYAARWGAPYLFTTMGARLAF